MVLVTGGTGFLGAYIIEELVRRGYAVRAISRSNAVPFFIDSAILHKVEWVRADVLDVQALEDAMDGTDTVIHAAAIVSFHARERKQMFRINIDGTANVVNAALEKNIRKLIHISSVAALGRTGEGDTRNEGSPWDEVKLHTHYAVSKYHAEMEVWRGMSEGLNAIIINPSTIIGYGDWNNTSCALFKTAYEEFSWYTNGINGFVDVRDVARAAVMLMAADVSAERFVVSSENWSFRQLLNSIADRFSKKNPSREATALLGSLAWRMEWLKSAVTGKPAVLTRESARIAQSKTYFDGSKILRYLPDFTYTALQQTIESACKAYLQQVSGARPLMPLTG